MPEDFYDVDRYYREEPDVDPKDARITRLVSLLREVEWVEIGERSRRCPTCDLWECDGAHKPSCRLAAALKEEG